MRLSIRQSYWEIARHYRLRKSVRQPNLCRWEYFVQMLISAYFSWRWIGRSARFRFWDHQYWAWLAHYSDLRELAVRASLADEQQRPAPPAEFANFTKLFDPPQKEINLSGPASASTLTEEWPEEITLEGDGV